MIGNLIPTLSLKIRSVALALLALVIALPATYSILLSAYQRDARLQLAQQLEIHGYMLIAEVELESDSNIDMPPQLPISEFNLPDSGLYASIFYNDVLQWQSLSSISLSIPTPPSMLPLGEGVFSEQEINNTAFFQHHIRVEFFDGEAFKPLTIVVTQDATNFLERQAAYSKTLNRILIGLTLLLMAILGTTLLMAIHPISHLKQQIKALQNHSINRIEHQYPQELESVKRQLNRLITNEQQQRERYKNSLGDLAHSLKTPLAVLMTMPELPSQAQTPIDQLNAIIQRQLKRASSNLDTLGTEAISIEPLINKIVAAMAKIHKAKSLTFHVNIPPSHKIAIDQTDWLELMGNLIDNAAKAASSKILISSNIEQHWITLTIDDDGCGINEEQREIITLRGKRLDSYQEGQGIGMAVVSDIIAAYEGKLVIDSNSMGGARVQVQFPQRAASED